jgi:lipopolysaccharide/colanic/teichoic acid biosynthesis glycosyltransferase
MMKTLYDSRMSKTMGRDVVRSSPATIFNRSWQKRAFDYIITIPGLIVISPLLFLIAIVIKLDSRGPVFFKQKRVGLDGRIFDVIKFRTMVFNADQEFHQKQITAYANDELDIEAGVKINNDPRITRVGRFLRNTSLDEFPQLLNVLKGEMSLVGPRPVPVYEADLYKLWHSERMGTLPGITGLWQIYGRSSVSFDQQLRMDIQYIRNQSLGLNLKILIHTIPVIINKKGAG